jgi:hypothetical protein
MKYTIIKRYRDAESGAVFNLGEQIELKDQKRIKELKASGCIQGEYAIPEPKKRGRKKK